MKRFLLPVTAIFAGLALTGCATSASLQQEVENAVSRSEGGSFQLSDLSTIDGSHFLVACPYESASSIEERLGFDWADAPDYSKTDDRQTIIIIDDGTVASYAELDRGTKDFCAAGQWSVLSIDSTLSVTRVSDSLVVSVS